MYQLRLKLARWLLPENVDIVFKPRGYTTPRAPESSGHVVEADGPDPKWKPNQTGGVIMQEPDLVRAERELNDLPPR